MNYQRLIQSVRGKVVEREHYGALVLIDENLNTLKSIGGTDNIIFYTRSCHKPFQAFSLITSSAVEKYNLTLEELAVCAGSHAGSKLHTGLVENVLNKIGLDQSYLKCGIHHPIDENARNHLIKNNLEPNVLHNNCSGKHAGMLAVCKQNGWDLETYLSNEHPLQNEIDRITKLYCRVDTLEKSVDGCGTPIPAMPLYNLAVGYQKLFLDDKALVLQEAFLGFPHIIGGKGRLDTEIIEASQGNLVAKVGAEGLCVVVNLSLPRTIALKVIDANMQARKVIMFSALVQLGWLTEEQTSRYCDLSVKTIHNETVGYIHPTFNL